MKIFIILFASFFAFSAFSQDEIITPSDQISSVAKDDFKDLTWNRYTTENFTILSIDNTQGKWLYSNIENIRSWCLKRWGLNKFKFEKECRIMVVPNKELFKKLFNLTESKYEIRKNKDELEILVVWLLIDSEEDLVDEVPYFVTMCSLIELNYKNNLKYNLVLMNGMSLLNKSINNIKNIKREDVNLESKVTKLFSIDEEKLKKMKIEEKKDFDIKSLILCLMLKKEFGENKFLNFMNSNKTKEDSLGFIYKFTPEDFNNTYNRYCRDLFKELKENKVPDRYIDVKKK